MPGAGSSKISRGSEASRFQARHIVAYTLVESHSQLPSYAVDIFFYIQLAWLTISLHSVSLSIPLSSVCFLSTVHDYITDTAVLELFYYCLYFEFPGPEYLISEFLQDSPISNLTTMESSRSDGATGSGLSENLLPEGKASDRTPLMTLRSTSSQENDTRPMTYLEGVGYVPSGPRSSRSSLSVQITREVRIASLPVVPKVEETVENVSFVNTENTQWYTSVSPLTEEPPPTFTDNYIQDFRMALATHNQDKSTGSQRRSSRRQDINGHRTREGSRQSTMSRFRSRSPTRLRVGSDARYYSSSPLFFPYEHEPRDRDGESITRTLSMGRTPRPARAEHVDDEDEKICTCPVSYDCRHRSATKLDCRSLVREYMPWRERRDQEAFDRLVGEFYVVQERS